MTVNFTDAPRERDKGKRAVVPLARRVEQSMAASSYRLLRQIHCCDHEGVVTLTGCVPKYFLKQMAQTIARSVEGVEEVVNRIVVGAAPSARTLDSARKSDGSGDGDGGGPSAGKTHPKGGRP